MMACVSMQRCEKKEREGKGKPIQSQFARSGLNTFSVSIDLLP